MSAGRHEEGLQVVKLGDGELRYQVDEEALQQVLWRPDVRDLPVVVVSVAGAYRGGKSFILDFFLRYLKAPRSSQLSGEWLGQEDQPLEGFHWRGGGERDTTGIHLWPQPIVTTLERTGEKVAVLLMDTQGTFDSESTIGENSTIFALSTLISSVQIYNLSGNIKEDDLQHLQLFTEYGKLATDANGTTKAFQTLIFLVRDWMSDYEHAHGYKGGDALLNKRLQLKTNQKPELREVREHIRSCFDEIKCFLMPHPSLNVANQNFNGCIGAITEKFRSALLELVPSLFDPSHLTPKLVNGERVKARDLLDYFKKYVDIFNSDEVPQAVTIFKATAAACLAAAARAARELYEARVAAQLREHASVAPRALERWHLTARDLALQLYRDKKKLGAQEDIDHQLGQLTKELDALLSLYKWNNDVKVRESMSLAKKVYEEMVGQVCEVETRLCLHPLDLEELHARATTAALESFDSSRYVPEGEEDEERATLAQDLEQQYSHLCALNEQNNKSVVVEARSLYVSRMEAGRARAVSSRQLRALHDAALGAARNLLRERRDKDSGRDSDPYEDTLNEEVDSCFSEFSKLNVNSNKTGMQVAEYAYNNAMSSAWGPQSCCFHPRALQELHERAMHDTLLQFLADREQGDDDDYKDQLVKILESRYSELQQINEFNNLQAVEQAFGLYTRKMDKHSQPALVSLLIVPFLLKMLGSLPEHHEIYKRAAEQEFLLKRRGTRYDEDEYYDLLMKKIVAAFDNYRNPLQALLREVGIRRD